MDGHDIQKPAAGQRTIVVGGGLAGISAALELADRGFRVTLLERRPYLGGRVYSFADKETGADVDNGQHVFMKCCVYYTALLRRLGVEHRTRVQRRLDVEVVDSLGLSSRLYRSPLPAPLHLLPSLLRYRHLSFGEKIRIMRTALAMRRLSKDERDRLDDMTFHDWLAARGETSNSMNGFWDIVILPTLNDTLADVSAAQAIMVFQEGFLRPADGADLGYAAVGLSRLLYEEAAGYIEAHGGEVRLSANVQGLDGDTDGITSVRLHEGTRLEADAYVLAVPPNRMADLLPPSFREDEFFGRAGQLAMSPIVNVHLWLDRRVTDREFAAYLDNEVQWVFNKSAIYGDGAGDGDGQHLCISISAAHRHIDTPKGELYELVLEELARALPRVHEAKVVHHVIIKERFATFRPSPGSARYRLPARTPVRNLFLAGAWTDTAWPSTMESAVRSGVFAAREVAAAA